MEYGYIRVSTKEQNEQRQLIAMREFGIAENRVYMDKQSGKDFERKNYKRLNKRLIRELGSIWKPGIWPTARDFSPAEAIFPQEYFVYYKGKWCTAGGKDPLFGHVDGFQIGPKKDFNQEIVSDIKCAPFFWWVVKMERIGTDTLHFSCISPLALP